VRKIERRESEKKRNEREAEKNNVKNSRWPNQSR
jgi:hypothetical protein